VSRKNWLILGAGVVIFALIATLRVVSFPSRPVGSVADLASLKDRHLNVVFILIDTLRADRLHAYGYERPTSPTLDDIASTGILFRHVESQSSWTKCSMTSLLTGYYPIRTGVLRFSQAIPEEARMPAEVFHDAGYVTTGLFRNGWVAPNFGFSQGFDVYVKPTPRQQAPQGFVRRPGSTKLPGTDEDITLAAGEFLRTYADQKFFLYLHYMDVHQYAFDQAAADLDFGSKLSDSYDASIHWVDNNVYRVLRSMDELGLLEKSLVVIAADHGEGFREHGVEGHARTLYREVVSVPLIFMLPFRLKSELQVEPVVRNVDIWPTIFDLVGLQAPAGADGRSLVPVVEASSRGETPAASPPAYAYLDQHWGQVGKEPAPLLAVREGDHRILWSRGGAGGDRTSSYDLREDPGERHDLGTKPAWYPSLRAKLERHGQQAVAWSQKEVEISEMYRAQLRALGYVEKAAPKPKRAPSP